MKSIGDSTTMTEGISESNEHPPEKEKKKYRTDLKRDKEDAEAEEEMKNINYFDFNTLPENPTVLICAKRGSGKTHLLPHLIEPLHKKYKYECAYFISPTAEYQVKKEEDPFFYIPKQNIINYFDENFVRNLLDKYGEIRKVENMKDKEDRVDRKVLLILDDIIGDSKATHSSVLTDLCTRGRHSNITLILLSQELSSRGGFNATMRRNIDLFVSFDIYDGATREMSGECFISKFNPNVGKMLLTKIPMLEAFMTVFVLCRHADKEFQARKYSDYVFKYKAPSKPPKHFVIGKDTKIKNISSNQASLPSTMRYKFKVKHDIY